VPRQRLGVALLLAEPLATQVDGLRRALGDPALGRVPAHLTLVPPVNVADRDLGRALSLLRDAASATEPFTVELGPVTTFHPVTPVCYLAVGGDLDAVHALRDQVFRSPLERDLTHPFQPHVTVADSLAPERIAAAVTALADLRVEVTFERVHLLAERRDGEHGRRWDPIADASFSRPDVIGRGGLPVELHVGGRPDPELAALLAIEGAGDGMPFAITGRRDGSLLGGCWGWTVGGHLELADLVVAAANRGEGVGRHLLGAVESLAGKRGCSALGVDAPSDGAPAAMLSGAGWVPVGVPVDGHRRWERRLSATE
jgi:2'-5' RNA ligase